MKRTKKELYPTLKITADEDNELDVAFNKDMQVKIISIADVDTKHGVKALATVEHGKHTYNVFVNTTSMNNLIDVWGDEDSAYINKLVDLKKETSEFYNKDMIVFHPVQ